MTNTANGRVALEQRRADALERQTARESRTPKQQIAALDKRGASATRERARLGVSDA